MKKGWGLTWYSRVPIYRGGPIKEGVKGFLNFKKKGVIIRWGGEDGKTDEKSRNLPQNYANLDELGRFWKILGSQKIIFKKRRGS